MLHWCAYRCAREHPVHTQNHAPRANRAKKNPSASLQLAEGALGTRRIVRAVLFHLSYPPGPIISRIYDNGGHGENSDCGFFVADNFWAASRRSASLTIAYLRYTDSVRCPVIFVATLRGTPCAPCS
jgi:hypothetical protein